MAEEKQEETQTNEGAESNNDSAASELDELRAQVNSLTSERNQFKGRFEEMESRYQQREKDYERNFGRQGQELGQRIKQLKDMIETVQPKPEAPKPRRAAMQIPDPVTDTEGFRNGLIEIYADLQERQQAFDALPKYENELKALREEVHTLRYKSFADREEDILRRDYELDDHDLEQVRGFMQESGIFSAEAAAIKIPVIKQKMLSNYAARQNNSNGQHKQEEKQEEVKQPARKSRASDMGKEMLKTQTDPAIHGGNGQREPGQHSKLAEIQKAIADDSFFTWPKAKQDEAADFLRHQAAGEGNKNRY